MVFGICILEGVLAEATAVAVYGKSVPTRRDRTLVGNFANWSLSIVCHLGFAIWDFFPHINSHRAANMSRAGRDLGNCPD